MNTMYFHYCKSVEVNRFYPSNSNAVTIHLNMKNGEWKDKVEVTLFDLPIDTARAIVDALPKAEGYEEV